MRSRWLSLILACCLALMIAPGDAVAKKKKCKKLCKAEIKSCRSVDCAGLKGKSKRACKTGCRKDALKACVANPSPDECSPPPTTTTTTAPGATTTTTIPGYGSAHGAFVGLVGSLLD